MVEGREVLGVGETGEPAENTGVSLRVRGTTLVELMVTIVMVGIFSGVLMSSLKAGNMKVDRARQRVVALSKVREQIEAQRAIARSGTLGVVTTSWVVPRSGGVGPYNMTLVITDVTTGGITNLFNVNCKATWTTNAGSIDNVELELWIRDDDE